MPTDSNGNYSLPPGYLAVTGQTVLASQHNPPLEDLGASMTNRYVRDGRTPMLGNVPMNGYRAVGAGDAVDDQDYVTKAQLEAAIAAVVGVPTGSLIPLTGSVIPAAWVAANGQTLDRATYPAFWAWVQASGNLAATEGAKTAGQYGPGDGSSTFSVPNLYADNGYFIRPISSGRTIGTIQTDEFKAHSHSGTATPDGDHRHSYEAPNNTLFFSDLGGSFPVYTSIAALTGFSGPHTHLLSINNTGGTETRPKNIAYPVIIKA